MPKYKISKSNLKEFFGLFSKKNKPKDIQQLIDNDPELKAIEKKIQKIDAKYSASDAYKALQKKYGL